MPKKPFMPDELRHRPFERSEAKALGVSSRMLQGKHFVRVFPRVWVHRGHVMSPHDWATAAKLALPSDAHMTGVTRFRELGMDVADDAALQFVVARDLHLEFEGVTLHRTDALPPTDAVGVTPAAALIEYCRTAITVDAIAVGDWLLHRGHMTLIELRELATRDHWRAGSVNALWVADRMDARARSLPESRVRASIIFAGLPVPVVNHDVAVAGRFLARVDLLVEEYRAVIEYEGGHHQTDRHQYLVDVDRYAALRSADYDYVQITKERAATPVKMVMDVYRLLCRQGYAGLPPDFGRRWRALFAPISAARHAWNGDAGAQATAIEPLGVGDPPPSQHHVA